jgi:hypothetical protein
MMGLELILKKWRMENGWVGEAWCMARKEVERGGEGENC